MKTVPGTTTTDVVLVGAGIMSTTLGALLRRLEPNWSITVVERLDAAAEESSDPWNNAGTGHAGLCELFYTPENPDGSIDIAKAVRVNEQFQVTRQFWAYAVDTGLIADARSFLHPIPHVAFGTGAERVDYLRRRHHALAANPLFAGTEFITGFDEFASRLPLMAAGRAPDVPVALDFSPAGTDVDFGTLAKHLLGYAARNGTAVRFGEQVRDLNRESDGSWTLRLGNRRTGQQTSLNARFVFVGAGGGALPLLQKSGIAEVRGFGGFPIGGKFLRCGDPAVVGRHRAKVYGSPAPGAPSTTAAHLDARLVNGTPWLLFGPFAGWSPRFLKHGRPTDLLGSIRPDNLGSLAGAALRERTLVGYLIGQLLRSPSGRIDALREFAPTAAEANWEIMRAGQRVQVIRGGRLEFDTSIVSAADGSIAGLLGASPGASTAVPAMLEVLARCFADRFDAWRPTLTEMVPSLGIRLSDEPALFEEVSAWGSRVLGLDAPGHG
ncbi:malate dehydrogenase (quinone) [Mycobacterium sp. M1]|uniref:Probable malate:quinone oxidoreductase n=1 Tax=Mycolicibacter acidiphilus TaxID=2835306 RepID=A0ABS5RKY4_9MYCO|nr:malate dehydrogenase (quinone) [Mycolicibacter acidiphilus]MBS9534156.1 malate dehydrogenase (quinone) [Mycolicibacter acidiphilus]